MAEQRIEIIGKHHAKIPKTGFGEHLWTIIGMWRVRPDASKRYELDHENLLTIEGPGCFHCEQKWTPELAKQPCPGRPLKNGS